MTSISSAMIAESLSAAGYPSAAFHRSIAGYLSAMRRWNDKHNLTAITDPGEMVSKHIIDSLTIADWLQGDDILDVGSGAGLPGIPLALHCPDRHFTLLDALAKRCFFLQHIVGQLGLNNVTVLHSRIEDFTNPDNTARFSTITCRAFTSLQGFVSATWSLLTDSGMILAMKGEYPGDEMIELNDWLDATHAPLRVDDVQPLSALGLQANRHIVILSRSSEGR